MNETENTVENPNTAIVSESESEPASQPTTPRVKRKKRHKREKKFVPNFDIPGVHKIVIDEETQNAIGCVAGDNVTAEKPWTTIDKDLFLENSDTLAKSPEFLILKQEILDFPKEEILIGYIPDETNDFDEFYICATEEATATVNTIIEKMREIQEEKLKNAIHKQVKPWKSLGSEQEVDESMVKVNRTLIEVEIESKYPILPFKIHFRNINTQDLRDGYMVLRPTEDIPSTIYRRRIDTSTQVAPSKISNEAQTTCTYPKHSCTQYEYTIPPDFEPSEECTKVIDAYIEKNMDNFCDILKVNGTIDLYVNDYEKLIRNPKFSFKVSFLHYKNYMDFIDMELCKGKMISSLCWHPMWSGCFVASYIDTAPALYHDARSTDDIVLKAVHDTNPVLFWSFKDDLKPKLILETNRPVHCVSCCPFDENLIIGGCSHGQLIIWDITNKLQRVEEEEILTIDQQNYRAHMYSLMNWMKNIFDLSIVRPAAMSDLKYSHKTSINGISWMSPFHQVTKTGKIEELEEERSLQFLTASEDGSIMIWDLLKKPTVVPGGFRSARKLRRLKKRPSALLVDESPYKKLHLNLKPIYKVNVTHNFDNQRILSISTMSVNFFDTLYEKTSKENKKKLKISERVIFQPVLERYKTNPEPKFHVGTLEGDYIEACWEGQEFDGGEVVNFENCKFISYSAGKYHDGPVVSIDYAASTNCIVSVGGKTFAIWREDFTNRPILWRRSSSIYTQGGWFNFDNSALKLIRIDGYIELWTLFHKSKSPLQTELCANGPVTDISTQPRKVKVDIFGIADYRGSFRIYYTNFLNPLVVKAKEENMSQFLTSEIQRKKAFLQWQIDWNKRYELEVEKKKSEEKVVIIEEPTKPARKEKKKIKEPSAGERYLEVIQDQQKASELARIKSVILEKKQLNTEELLKQREPLNRFEQENEVKKRKQKNKLKEADKIFNDTVAMLFPDVIKEKPPPPPNPYEDTYSLETKKETVYNYHNIAMQAQDYVEENPFSHDFNWKKVLLIGRERRRRLDDSLDKARHKNRYKAIKEAKVAALEAKKKSTETIIPKAASRMSTSSRRSVRTAPSGEAISEATV